MNRSVAVFDNRATVHDIVIILADLDKSCVHRDFAVGIDIVHRAVRHRVHTKFGNALYKFAGCAVKFKDTFSQRSGILKNLNSVCQITVIVEIVSLAVNFIERHVPGVTRQIITRSVVITGPVAIRVPCAPGHTGFVKLIGDAVYSVLARHCGLGIAAEIVPVAVDLLPAAGQNADFGEIPFLFKLNKSCVFALALAVFSEVIVNAIDSIDAGYLLTVNIVVIPVPAVDYCYTFDICLAVGPYTIVEVFAVCTFKNSVNNLVAVSCCGNGRAPVNNRVADFAERSACIT